MAVVSDDRLHRESIAGTLATCLALKCITSHGADPVELGARRAPDVDVVVIDVTAGERLVTIARVRQAFPGAQLIVTQLSGSEEEVLGAAEAGVDGFITKEKSLAQLAEAVREVAAGRPVCTPIVTAVLLRRLRELSGASHDPLTLRERQVAELAAAGMTNRQIATELVIEPATVKNHIHNILGKLGAKRRGDIGARLRAPSRSRSSVVA